MEAVLVVFACAMQRGCVESRNLYYETNAEFRTSLLTAERKATDLAGPIFITYVAPPLAIYYGSAASFKLSNNFSSKVSKQNIELIFNLTF